MTESLPWSKGHVVDPRKLSTPGKRTMQWRVVDIPPDITRAETTQLLSEQAEYGRWELARTLIYVGGARRVWLRRRSMRVSRTDAR